jgi:Tfp pilus assembly protein PilO
MRVRDRLVVAVIVAIAIAGGMWMVLVSPERAQVASLSSEVTAERTALSAAEASVVNARHALTGYVGHLHQIDQVMRAVPQIPAEADVVATIDRLTGKKINPDFRAINVGTSSATGTGPVSLGLSFSYWTTYQGLQHFVAALDRLTVTNGTSVRTSGRLFTVTSIALAPLNSDEAPPNVESATVTAQVYLQGSPSSPTPATGATGATGAS